MSLADRVLRTVRTRALIPAGSRVLIALSGGPDSVGLVWLLREIHERVPLEVAGLLHVNHRLREAADADEAFCRALAGELQLPFRLVAADVRAIARERHLSVEDAGRKVRYDAFERARVALGADLVATGHTRDDQAETFLLRLVRGAGPRGLAGIYPVAGRVVRPLIDVAREDVRAYLREAGRPFCEDASNFDLAIPRNRVRHELLPSLRTHFSPGIVDVLARQAELARVDADYLDRAAIELAGSIVLRGYDRSASGVRVAPGGSRSAPSVELDAEALASLHPALASRVARLALTVLAPDKFIGFDRVAELLALAAGPDGGSASLPGQQAIRRGRRILLTTEPVRPFANSFSVPLSIPGEVTLETQGWAITAARADRSSLDLPSAGVADEPGGGQELPGSDGLIAAVDANRLAYPLAVRSRRPGDRFAPPGLGGRQRKLQDVLVDRKIARADRDCVPLVVDAKDRIVWIVGVSVSGDFRVTEPSQGVIFLKARRLGGPG
ncbi:MAG TPA: tRNA lysidine(34) synthetase TilS [Vicinamibacterales bacterium]|nr:tRNA lysidine(34) synthetase TilS [Vicinamibacterales bacterium]